MTAGPGTALQPPAALGALGGGQLGRMFLQAAQRLGYRTVVLSPSADSPAAQVAQEVIVGPPGDGASLRAFAARVEAVTVEFENVPASALRWLERVGRITRPGWRTIWVSQNRLREKTFLSRGGFPVAPWLPVRTEDELLAVPGRLGLPVILKTSDSGYDGKGQVRIGSVDELDTAWSSLNRVSCVAEAVVAFELEVSVIVARGHDGESVTYPVFWNSHARHILDTTVAPAPIGPIVSQEARDLARSVAIALGTVGLLTVEFFVTSDGRLLINELAPRPHNSGHLTLEAATISQFEQQVRALAGLPLGTTDLLRPAAMANLLGDLWNGGEPNWSAALADDPGAHLHLYGKDRAAPGRKMGHLTVLDPDVESALARVLAARRRAQTVRREG